MMRFACLTWWALLMPSCDRTPTRLEVHPLAAGEWTVLDASEHGALVQLNHTAAPTIRMLTDRLTPVVVDTFSLHAGHGIIQLVRVAGGVFYGTLPPGPRLRRSPTDPQLYAFEHEDAIWLFRAPDGIHKLTLDDDLERLRGQQREGAVILYWSVNPVWSGDGEFIAFLSNREAVRASTPGQSIWAIDAYTGVQRAIFVEPNTSAYVDAAFGEGFVFSASDAPGVFSVHPRTGTVTRLGDGYVMGAHEQGAALLLNDHGRLRLLHGSRDDSLPAAPAGQVWSTHASFSPSGRRIALWATDQAGGYALHVMDHNGALAPAHPLPAPPSSGPHWTSETSLIFTVSERGVLQTLRAQLR